MERLKIVKGNTFETLVEVRSYTYDGEELTSFDLRNCSKIVVKGKVSGYSRTQKFTIQDANHILITWNGKSMRVGNYTLEVTGKLGNVDWRFYDKTPIFLIVNTNAEAYIPENCVVTDNCYRVNKQSLYIATSSSSTPGEKGEKGDKGDKGDDGASAYEIAVQNGFVGTETEWLASLKGEKGDTGIQGEQGPAGQDGADGLDGAPGLDGLDGAPGQDGQDGLDGITPHIDSSTGNWFIGTTNTGVHAQGPAGLDAVSPTLATVATSGDYDDLLNKPTIPTIPTNVSTFTNDAGYLTSVPNTCVTSTTTGLKIEVVASLPASPDSNTIYIVQ